MTNRRLYYRTAGQGFKRPAAFIGFMVILVWVIQIAGCASRQPASVLIEHPIAAVPTNQPDKGFNLKLVTYNIWGLPSWMTGARSGRYPKIARELERLDADIILLQEAWTAKARESAPTNGQWSIARAAGQHTFFQQSGLETLSKYPVIGGEFYPFSQAAFPDRFVNKGALKVTVQLPHGQVLNVWNVHFQDGGSTELQLSQVREFLSQVQAAEDGQIADLVGGDFNCTPESCFYHELTNSLGPSALQQNGAAPFVTWDGLSSKPGAGQTLDYVFVRARVPSQAPQAVQQVAFAAASFEQRLSDHFGIEASVNLSPISQLAAATASPLQASRLAVLVAAHGIYPGGLGRSAQPRIATKTEPHLE